MNNQIHKATERPLHGPGITRHTVPCTRAAVHIYRGGDPHGLLKISDASLARVGDRSLRINLTCDQDDQWHSTSRFIRQRYLHAFDACIDVTFPELIWVNDQTGAVLAAAGVRTATAGRLFLEQYLNGSIEDTVAVARTHIVEIGNLVSVDRDATVLLFSAMALILERRGITHAAATGTRLLEKRLRTLGLQMTRLCEASIDRLDQAPDQWGDYYRSSPHVLVGSVPDCAKKLRSRLAVELCNAHRCGVATADGWLQRESV